jgi:hypothetical protein
MGKALWKTRQVIYFLLFEENNKTVKKIENAGFCAEICRNKRDIFIR